MMEALRLVQNSGDDNLKAAIHFERGKVLMIMIMLNMRFKTIIELQNALIII